MIPIARANLDRICCICFLDLKPLLSSQKVYDVKKENNLSKALKLTAHITVLKNPINQKYINDYCRKICETCYIKIQYSYTFRERIIAAAVTLKELLESDDLNAEDIERLNSFCRICLNRQKTTSNTKCLTMTHLIWLKNCTGVRFTSIVDIEAFRLKEGTNINEIVLINDNNFPRQLCLNCFKKLKNVEEFRQSATQSFDYMISVMGDDIAPEDYFIAQNIQRLQENIVCSNMPHGEPVEANCEIFNIKNEAIDQENSSTGMHDSSNDWEKLLNTTAYSNVQQLEIETFKNELEFVDELSRSPDNSDEHFIFNNDNENNIFCDSRTKEPNQQLEIETFKDELEFVDELPHSSDNFDEHSILNNDNENNIFWDSRTKESNQFNKNENNLRSKKENINRKNSSKAKVRMEKFGEQLELRKSKQLKENATTSLSGIKNTDTEGDNKSFECEDCSKIFTSKYAYKRHQRTVHKFDANKIMHCLICAKTFKRLSHLTDHIKAVHEKLRPFKCSHCSKTFTAKNSRRVHELQHTGDYPFVCNCCGKMFRRSNELKIHLEIHTTNPELLCPICKRSQKSESDLANHLKSHDDKRLQCTLCGKFFTRSYHLKDHHNAVHLKLRPFKCEFCDLAYGDRKTRRIHEKTHTEDRPIKCTVCKSGFNTRSALTKHIYHYCHPRENEESFKEINEEKE